MKPHLALLTALLVIRHSSFVIAQGPLTPPGAPAPTMKTLDQVEARIPISAVPFTINSSGSYYLTSNLITAPGQTAITVNTGNVTIDLNGFQLLGSGGATAHGVRLVTGVTGVTIRHGIVRGFSGDGVSAESANCTEMRVEYVTATSNGARGIVLGDTGSARDCLARSNGTEGIVGGVGCRVTACTAINHPTATLGGIVLGNRAIVTDCTSISNATEGIEVGANSIVVRCAASANTGIGVLTGGNGLVEACLTNANGNGGISAGIGSLVVDSLSDANVGVSGIAIGNSSAVTRCVVRGSTSPAASSQGIFTGTDCTVSECTVQGTTTTAGSLTATTGMGINAGSSSVVERCTVNDSRGDGVRAGASCRVIGNTSNSSASVAGADGAGIHTVGANIVVDGNIVGSAVRGIEITGTGGTIIRNRVQSGGALNYVIAGNNNYGAIVVPAIGGAVSGNAAVASTVITTDPWANISQ